jgi:hypothetical protein
MLTDECIQQVFSLAYSLHPHRVVAWEVTREALKRGKVMSNTQGSRPAAHRPYKQKLEESNLLRASVFAVSEKWERDQESRAPEREPIYTPTTEDLLYRYLKTLVWHSMDRESVYAAVGIGSLLFTYPTNEIAAVSVDFFDNENIRRVKSWLLKKVESRFSDVMVIPNDSGGQNAPRPTEYQFAFVNRALNTLAPHIAGHPSACSTDGMLLDEFFSYDSIKNESERVHVIMNTECGGWARMVDEYNQLHHSFPSHHLDAPADKLRVPIFGDGLNGPQDGSKGDDNPSVIEDRFDSEPLNAVEVRSLVQQVDHPPTSGSRDEWDIAA